MTFLYGWHLVFRHRIYGSLICLAVARRRAMRVTNIRFRLLTPI